MVDKIDGQGRILGYQEFDQYKHGHPEESYFRWATLLDCRGDLRIHSTARFGYRVNILTASHAYDERGMGRQMRRTVWIDEHAWVATGATLYHCWIQEHAIVGAGAVVKNVVVPAWSLAEGNPAKVVGGWDAEKGRYVKWPKEEWKEMKGF